MSDYKIRTTKIMVHPADNDTILSEMATTVSIDDEAGCFGAGVLLTVRVFGPELALHHDFVLVQFLFSLVSAALKVEAGKVGGNGKDCTD